MNISDLQNFEYKGKVIDISTIVPYIESGRTEMIANILANYGIEHDDVYTIIKTIQESGDLGQKVTEEDGVAFFGKPVYYLQGCRGRKMSVYEDFVVISVEMTIGSVMTGNVLDGEKVIFFKDCIGVQFKKCGSFIGYLQLETAAATMNNGKSNFYNENTFTFDDIPEVMYNKLMEEVYEYVFKKVYAWKKPEIRE